MVVIYFARLNRPDVVITPVDEDPDVPSAPGAPLLIAEGYESITISWNEPNYHRSVIVAYEVQVAGPEGNFSTHEPGPGLQRVYEAQNLTPGSPHLFRVRALNGVGAGNWSGPSDYQTLQAAVPDPPSQARVTATTQASISLSWTPVRVFHHPSCFPSLPFSSTGPLHK